MTRRGRTHRFIRAPACAARIAPDCVPDEPGYYAIFVDSPPVFLDIFAAHIPETRLIYVGMATRSLLSRLVYQDLRHDQPASFFRSLGAALNFRPQKGSLVGNANTKNYRFSATDTRKIIEWIDEHLSVSWSREPPLEIEEKRLIRLHRPLFNIKHNPQKCKELVALRRLCRERACEPPNKAFQRTLEDSRR